MLTLTKINRLPVDNQQEFELIKLTDNKNDLIIKNKFGFSFTFISHDDSRIPIFSYSANQALIGFDADSVTIIRLNSDIHAQAMESLTFYCSELEHEIEIECTPEGLLFNSNADKLTIHPETGNSFRITIE